MQTAEKGGAADEAPSVKACLVYDSHTKIAPKVSRGGRRAGTSTARPPKPKQGRDHLQRRAKVRAEEVFGPNSRNRALIPGSQLHPPGTGKRT